MNLYFNGGSYNHGCEAIVYPETRTWSRWCVLSTFWKLKHISIA